jgi:hypothetical protein
MKFGVMGDCSFAFIMKSYSLLLRGLARRSRLSSLEGGEGLQRKSAQDTMQPSAEALIFNMILSHLFSQGGSGYFEEFAGSSLMSLRLI